MHTEKLQENAGGVELSRKASTIAVSPEMRISIAGISFSECAFSQLDQPL